MTTSERSILLVEDNPDEVVLTLRALKKGKILNDLHTVSDGAEALAYLFAEGKYAARARQPLPTVVLLDLNLPKVSGLEVLQRMRADERTRLVPVVILTTSKEDDDVINGYKLGANSYIRKPVDFNQFAQAIHNLGLYWLVINEPPPPR
jgi:two-component system, response regulator